ncbi:uncharacterized protein LOC135836085 isoform X2 [Planococcus citri]|uniref:uncharacterized protein LOC135836085 isoform X2 n=1 Tax=Planococcus citri TaxID=170843 RepID=UPI0031F83417
MVAAQFINSVLMMTPGSNSMLRARRKDKDVKPNRHLDRTASRGMLYENEDLRLRTININADLEKGQQYIKKLRRENNQLRREIWSLRDQYDKLENVLKAHEQEQVIIEELERGDSEREDGEQETLSIVEEENESEITSQIGDENNENCCTEIMTDTCSNSEIEDMLKQFPHKVNVGTIIELVTRPKNDDLNSSCENEASKMCSLKKCDDFVGIFKNYTEEYHTLVFSTEAFENLTVQEIIDELEQQLKENCRNIVKGIRLTSKNAFITVNSSDQCQTLVNSGLKIRNKPITLDNIWEKSSILQLSAVPPHVPDEQIIAAISRFADVIGNIERQTYKGFDTGERFIQVKSREAIPGQLLFGSTCLDLSVVYPRSTPIANNISRRKSFRSQININLKPPDSETETPSTKSDDQPISANVEVENAPKPEPSFFSKSTGITLSVEDVDKKSNVFEFPTSTPVPSTPAPTQNHNNSSAKKKSTLSTPTSVNKESKSSNESPSAFRKFSQRRNNSGRKNIDISQPPSPVPFQGQGTPRMVRKSSVNFRNNGEASSRIRSPEMYSEYGSGYLNRERSASDASSRQSICRRKLSVTGHEGSTKIPWCGCWGIGCC